jgi:drug/metabolite transporter (DMT)-like permease
MRPSTTFYGYCALALAMVLVGSSFVVAKVLTTTLPLFLANSIRFTFAALALAPLMFAHREALRAISRADIQRLALLSLTGVFLFNVFLFLGLRHIGAGTSGVITSFTPLVVSLLSFVLLKEAVTPTKVVAILTATLGILLINTQAAGAHDFSWLGFALIFGVVLCDAAFILLAKSVSARLAPKLMSVVVVCASTVFFLPVGIWQLGTIPDLVLSLKDWLLLAYLGVVVNAITYFLWYTGLKIATASQAAVFTGIMPISSLVLAYLFLSEPLTLADGAGLTLVLAGVFVITKQSPEKKVSAAAIE